MKNESGFTLIEVIVAMVLLSLLVIGMAAAPLSSRQMRARAELKAAAMNYAEKIIEEYRSWDFDNINDETETTISELAATNTAKNLKDITYTYQVNVQGYTVSTNDITGELDGNLLEENTDPQVKQVTVTVKWSGEGYSDQIQLSALMGE